MSKFIIKKSDAGYSFTLTAPNGRVIIRSEVYKAEKSSIKGVESIQHNATKANFEDQTIEGYETATNPKFVLFSDKAGQFRFHLAARNGEIIGASESYKTKESCLNGISSVRENAVGAIIEKSW